MPRNEHKTEGLKLMRKVLIRLENLFTFLSVASTVVMVCLTTADALGRYFFTMPIPGAYEITESYLLVFCVYFGLVYSYREGANIRITILVSRFPQQVKLLVDYFVQIFSILYVVFLFATSTIVNFHRIGKILEMTKFSTPLWPSYLIICVGLFLLTLWVVADLWVVKTGESGLFNEGLGEESVSL